MKKKLPRRAGRAAGLLLLVCLLTGCAALLERSYGVVEPYADRYWDTGAEDTLRVESYQDLVNSLLLLIEERAEEGVILCYGEAGEYREAMAAREEVRRETMLGAYLLRDIRITCETGVSYSTVTCQMIYREDAEDMASIMTLSDSQSLVDLLRVTVREERSRLTARFSYDTPREDVTAAVESFWQELCQAEMEEEAALEASGEIPPEGQPEEEPGQPGEPDEAPPEGEPEEPSDGGAAQEPEELPEAGEEEPDGEEPEEPGAEPEEPPVEYPPCPWQIRFYPDKETAEIVEVILKR